MVRSRSSSRRGSSRRKNPVQEMSDLQAGARGEVPGNDEQGPQEGEPQAGARGVEPKNDEQGPQECEPQAGARGVEPDNDEQRPQEVDPVRRRCIVVFLVFLFVGLCCSAGGQIYYIHKMAKEGKVEDPENNTMIMCFSFITALFLILLTLLVFNNRDTLRGRVEGRRNPAMPRVLTREEVIRRNPDMPNVFPPEEELRRNPTRHNILPRAQARRLPAFRDPPDAGGN